MPLFQDLLDTVVVASVRGPIEGGRAGAVDAVERDSLMKALSEKVDLTSFGGLVERKAHLVVRSLADGGSHVVRRDQTRRPATRTLPPSTLL